jgi:hypothetical protein
MILASLKPYYYYLIGERKKTIEVRKSALKDLPQDIVFYMSKDEKSFAKIPKEFQEKYREHFGKVGIRAVVDNMDVYAYDCCDGVDIDDDMLLETMIDRDYINIYAKGKPLYGWHISDLKIYDKPKELSEFKTPPCEKSEKACEKCKYLVVINTPDMYEVDCFVENGREISRPPQSYMFVEEVVR